MTPRVAELLRAAAVGTLEGALLGAALGIAVWVGLVLVWGRWRGLRVAWRLALLWIAYLTARVLGACARRAPGRLGDALWWLQAQAAVGLLLPLAMWAVARWADRGSRWLPRAISCAARGIGGAMARGVREGLR